MFSVFVLVKKTQKNHSVSFRNKPIFSPQILWFSNRTEKSTICSAVFKHQFLFWDYPPDCTGWFYAQSPKGLTQESGTYLQHRSPCWWWRWSGSGKNPCSSGCSPLLGFSNPSPWCARTGPRCARCAGRVLSHTPPSLGAPSAASRKSTTQWSERSLLALKSMDPWTQVTVGPLDSETPQTTLETFQEPEDCTRFAYEKRKKQLCA